MGVVISKPAINIREQLTELKATQGYEERQFHFDGLVTNGTFDTDTSGWSAQNSATLSAAGAELTVTNGATAFGYASQAITTEIGRVYTFSVDVTDVSSSGGGGARIRIGTSLGGGTITEIQQTTAATVTHTFTAETTTTYLRVGLWLQVSGSSVSFDNISVYEVDPNDSNKVIHTMPKGWKPLHVFEDGALQREGSAYDYTVEYDGFNYIVKETVAPVAPYSTTVIGVRA
jgi:hypothetical protein